jgi:hypothetical protein
MSPTVLVGKPKGVHGTNWAGKRIDRRYNIITFYPFGTAMDPAQFLLG